MRHIVFLSMLFFGLFFSCTPKKAPDWSKFPKLYLTGVDTIIKDSCSLYDKTTVTGFTCEGRPYAKEKMIPRGYISGHYVTTQGSELSKDSLVSLLKQAGRENLIPERENIGYSIPWDILKWIGLVIMALLLLWLLLWLLREFLNWFNEPRNNSQGALYDRQTGQPIGGGGSQNPPVNQPVVTAPSGTWVPFGHTLLGPGMVAIHNESTYLGIRREGEVLMAEMGPVRISQTSTTQSFTNGEEEEKTKTNIL